MPDLLLPTVSGLLLEPAWAVAEPPGEDAPKAAALHRLRRRIKRVRYEVECLAPVLVPAVAGWLEELHALQDALGAWHDAGVLLPRLVRLAPPGPLHAAVSAEAVAALAPWPAWRARYVQPVARGRLRALLSVSPSHPGAPHGAG
ncbi:MAG: CHAD domain-containing protein [Gemmatimonadetes bacterium]|nr:CHAD domain-containing protein [Gemmatimonadota bacterium]